MRGRWSETGVAALGKHRHATALGKHRHATALGKHRHATAAKQVKQRQWTTLLVPFLSPLPTTTRRHRHGRHVTVATFARHRRWPADVGTGHSRICGEE